MFCWLTMDHLGRKPLFVGSMFLAGSFCIVSAFLPVGTFRTVFALVGKCMGGKLNHGITL